MGSISRRLILVLVSILVVSLAIFIVATVVATSQSTEQTLQRELNVSERVLRSTLEQRGQELVQAAAVLTNDFGFRQAVATGDDETIISALTNQGDRINSDLIALLDPQGEVLLSSHQLPSLESNPFFSAGQGGNLGFMKSEGSLFQLVVVPVRAPNLIGWVGLGFIVDDTLAERLKELTSADVTFVVGETGREQVASSTLGPQTRVDLEQVVQSAPDQLPDWLKAQGLRGEFIELSGELEPQPEVLLSLPYDAVVGPFRTLRQQLIVVIIVTLLASSLVGSIWGRRIVQPLRVLTHAARDISQGNYKTRIENTSKDELGELADSFRQMQGAIADREAHISHQLYHDGVTGLPNRQSLALEVERYVKRERPFRLVLISLTNFNEIMDTFGQSVMERLLKEAAARLKLLVPQQWLGCVAENKFVLLDTRTDADAETYDELVSALDEPFVSAGVTSVLRFSVAVTGYPEHGVRVDDLLRQAQITTLNIKKLSQRVGFYKAGEDDFHMRQLSISMALKSAVQNNEFSLVYQPQLEAANRTPVAVEALLRWHSPTLGFVGPDEFIPLAEQSGEIQQVTRWVLHNALHQLMQWQQANHSLRMAINLSAADLTDKSIVLYISDLLDEFALSPSALVVEVTESAVMQDAKSAIALLNDLRERGVDVAIDDYGTGFSSLTQLRTLPATELKIDKFFVMKLDTNNSDQMIVKSTIGLAHHLGLKVVAEGVENEASAALLASYQCDYLQGYYFARPMAAVDLSQWLEALEKDKACKNQ
ncbi:putative bifunctional diguanylate cyclase/phosphodiesterase [Aliidiomarina sp. Khilg15.8]